MTIRIGHASIDENGKATGGASGDQNGKEVCIRNWYNGGWEFLVRPKNNAVAEKMALACEAGCANNNIGYDQNQRNTLNTQARKVNYDLSKITTPCETDCSAFVSVCVLAAGVDLDYEGNLPTTRTLQSKLTQTGAFEIYTDSQYLTGTDYLRRGDILCKAGSHTVMVLSNGAKAAPSASSSKSNATGSAACTVKATDRAKSFLKSLAGTYTVTADWLNVRYGAGVAKPKMTSIPKGTKVICYGYYTAVLGVTWLYVQFTDNGVLHAGFVSNKYLKK